MIRSQRWRTYIETFKIRARNRKIIPLRYNAPQQMVWRRIAEKIDRHEAIRVIVLKARREGISTLVEALLLAFCASSDNVNALVTAHQAKASSRIWNMSKLMVTKSPLLSRVATIGKLSITIGGSLLEVSTAGSPEAERSADLTAWHASEVAFWQHPEAMLATMQTLPPPNVFSIGVIESTANGKVGQGQMFHNEWERAEAGDSEWIPIFLSWMDFPDYRLPRPAGRAADTADEIDGKELDDEEEHLREELHVDDEQLRWRRWAIANLCGGDVEKFHQEYPSTANEAFIQSGLPFFRPAILRPMERYLEKGIRGVIEITGKFVRDDQGYLEIFRQPIPGHEYVIGADSSFGLDNDDDMTTDRSRSAGEVLDMDTLEQVAEYDASSAPHIQARHLVGMGRLYNNALVAPEVQASGGGGGREIIVYLRDWEYWNIHRWKGHVDAITRTPSHLYGWETNARTRPRMLARIREVVMEMSAIIHSKRLYNQLSAFGENDAGRMESLQGHDDLLFAWGIAIMSRFENYFKATPSSTSGDVPPDWRAMGMRVTLLEDPQARIRRLLASPQRENPEKAFMEL